MIAIILGFISLGLAYIVCKLENENIKLRLKLLDYKEKRKLFTHPYEEYVYNIENVSEQIKLFHKVRDLIIKADVRDINLKYYMECDTKYIYHKCSFWSEEVLLDIISKFEEQLKEVK